MKEAIRAKALELGFDLCRFTTAEPPATRGKLDEWLAMGRHGEMSWLARNAEKRTRLQFVLPGCRSVICLAASYFQPGTDDEAAGKLNARGIVARYACHDDYHDVFAERLKALEKFINEMSAVKSRSLWYVDTGPILERDLAQRAGMGFIGKHTNLIARPFGNWILLGEILTTLELEPDSPEKNRCGSCERCITACPTKAITGPFQLDARLCISYLTIELKGSIPVELRPLIGGRIFGCDDCLEACPWNRFAKTSRMMQTHTRTDLTMMDLAELLKLDEAGFKARFRGTPMLRSKRRGLLRNACVALGNIGDESSVPALLTACGDSEPLVAEHASWAVSRIRDRRPPT